MESEPHRLVDHFFRHQYGQIVAVLTNFFGLEHIELAEDLVQESLLAAMEQWALKGIPDNPGGWLMDVAKKKCISHLRRKKLYQQKIVPNLRHDHHFQAEQIINLETEAIPDSMLKMIFSCCHPTLTIETQVTLALKTLCGLSIGEISDALLTSESTTNKRLYRGKERFRSGKIQLDLPADDLESRREAVLLTLYLLFNEGYYSAHHEQAIRADLCYEAIRLLRMVVNAFPEHTPSRALLALMHLQFARFEARLDSEGVLIVLADQDRSLWHQDIIAQGIDELQKSMQGNRLSTYHLKAGIAAEHCLAPNLSSTNWRSITKHYRQLVKMEDSPVVRLNFALALSMNEDHKEALQLLQEVTESGALIQKSLFHAAASEIYQRAGKAAEALYHLEKAISLSRSPVERARMEARKLN